MQQEQVARSIGDVIRGSRKRLGMTRKQLSATAEVSERYLNDLENGGANVSIGILVRVAGALQLDLASVMSCNDGASASAPVGAFHPALSRLLQQMSTGEQAGAVVMLETYLEERRRASRGIALIGLRGAGKSTLGQLLSRKYGIAFVSVTKEVEARAGLTLDDLFHLGGPEAYRALENDVVTELAGRKDRIVLETAGGIVGNSDTLEAIMGTFKTVWLKASPEEHLARVAEQGDTRPTRGFPEAIHHLRALIASREPEYARAEFVIDTTGRSVEDCFADLERVAAPLLAQ